MLLPLVMALGGTASASSDIEFKTSGPVSIFVDGRQATLQSNLRQRVSGLDPGIHELKVVGMLGKTLFEAEIDLPDDTMTYASWEKGEVKVLRTEWLEEDEEDDAPAVDTGLDEEAVAEELPVEEPAVEIAEPVAPVAAPDAPAIPVATAPVEPPLAMPAAPPVREATSVPAATKPRTLTVQASDGMRVEVVHDGRTLVVVIDGDTFRIEDPTGLELALGGQ